MRKQPATSTSTRTCYATWVRELSTDPQHAFPDHGQMKPEQQEIDRLRKEVAKLLRVERDILRKAAAFFAREAI